MKTHSELYSQSLELVDLINKYSKEKDYTLLEKTLLELMHTYGWLNFYEEDEYLEDLIDTQAKLVDVYYILNNQRDALTIYFNMMECYDDLIQRDKKEEELLKKHINNLKSAYLDVKVLFDKLEIKDNIKEEFPRLRKYLE